VRIEGWRLVELWYVEYSKPNKPLERRGRFEAPLRHDDRKCDPAKRPGFPEAPSTAVILIEGFCCWFLVHYSHDLNLTVVRAAAGLRRYVTNLTYSRTLRRHNLGPIIGQCLVLLWQVSPATYLLGPQRGTHSNMRP
jgi:hypothetical protein